MVDWKFGTRSSPAGQDRPSLGVAMRRFHLCRSNHEGNIPNNLPNYDSSRVPPFAHAVYGEPGDEKRGKMLRKEVFSHPSKVLLDITPQLTPEIDHVELS